MPENVPKCQLLKTKICDDLSSIFAFFLITPSRRKSVINLMSSKIKTVCKHGGNPDNFLSSLPAAFVLILPYFKKTDA